MGGTGRVASVRPPSGVQPSKTRRRHRWLAPPARRAVAVDAGVASIVRIRLGRPVLFRQSRPGLGERPFILVKFRTMTDSRDSSGRLLPDERRLTGLGRLLRSTSLDELPELLNVLRGEMSLDRTASALGRVYRALLASSARRHEVHPGLTGLAQVSGRNLLSWPQKLEADLVHRELVARLDLTIIWKTMGRSSDAGASRPEI